MGLLARQPSQKQPRALAVHMSIALVYVRELSHRRDSARKSPLGRAPRRGVDGLWTAPAVDPRTASSLLR